MRYSSHEKDNVTVDQLLENFVVEGDRPKLAPGKSWGADLTPDEIVVGDQLYKDPVYPKRSIYGKVLKASRINLEYEGLYGGWGRKEPMKMQLKARREDMVGGYIMRGNKVHKIVYKK